MGVAGTAAVMIVYAAWVRPRLMRWGATDEEVTEAYPGAELVPHGQRAATMAVTWDCVGSEICEAACSTRSNHGHPRTPKGSGPSC